jgi:hypothetical protein
VGGCGYAGFGRATIQCASSTVALNDPAGTQPYPAVQNNPNDGNSHSDVDLPYRGPAEDHIDLWVGYSWMITHGIEWRIRPSSRNAYEHAKLVPVTVQPDGSPGEYRVADGQTWELTNSSRFLGRKRLFAGRSTACSPGPCRRLKGRQQNSLESWVHARLSLC